MFFFISVFFHFVYSHTAIEWSNSRIIYQLITDRFANYYFPDKICTNLSEFCGGTFQGIIQHLDYIEDLGFNAIWISPVVQNSPDGYHGYFASNWSSISTEFGGVNGLKYLITEAHKRDIWVMVDVVANHVAADIQLEHIYPFNSISHYHDCVGCGPSCNILNYDGGYNNEHCKLYILPDLNQDNYFVRNTLLAWIYDLTYEFQIDGIRIDTVPMVKKQFWSEYIKKTGGIYTLGEVSSNNVNFVASYQDVLDGVLSYPLYYTIISVFAKGNSMNLLSKISEQYSAFSNRHFLGTFLDNHDCPRFLSINSDINLLKNALVYTLFFEGIPIIYYGTEQGFNGKNDPYNREPMWYSKFKKSGDLYTFIKKIVHFRKSQRGGHDIKILKTSTDISIYMRGNDTIVVTTNSYRNITVEIEILNTIGGIFCNLFEKKDCINSSKMIININFCRPKIYYKLKLFDFFI